MIKQSSLLANRFREVFLVGRWVSNTNYKDQLENLPKQRLKDFFVDERYGTYQRNIDGMIEHCYYHLRQIVLLNKFLSNREV